MTHKNISGGELSSFRWVMLALLCGLYCCFGMIARSLSPLVTPIIADLQISFAEMGFVLGAWQITYILISLINGPIVDRWGVRWCLFIGAVIMSLSAFMRFFPVGFVTLLLSVALFGVGAPFISIGGPKTIALWFEGRSRSTAFGIFMAANITGSLAALSLTNSVVMPAVNNSWRWTFVVFGVIVFLAALFWLAFAREKTDGQAKENISQFQVFWRLIRIRKVQIILVMGLFSFAVFHGLNSWLPKILETGGLSPSIAGYAASVPSLASIPAIIFIPRIIPVHSRGKTISVFSLITSIQIIVITTAAGLFLIGGLVLLGLTAALVFPLIMLILMDTPEIGAEYLGTAGGIFFCVAEIGGVLGPFVVGALVDLTGSFLAGAFFLAALGLVILILAWTIKIEKVSV